MGVSIAHSWLGAEGRTRTDTGFPTTPSRWRVYQFHHFGTFKRIAQIPAQGQKLGYLARLGMTTLDPAVGEP